MAAGKNIERLILLILVSESGIDPLVDWKLFKRLKAKVRHIVRKENHRTRRCRKPL